MSSKVLIVYGTTDGHTKKVAEYMAKAALGLQRSVDVVNAKSSVQGALPEDTDWPALQKFTQGFLSTHKLMQLLA